MRCDEIAQLLSEYVDGVLTDEAREQVEQHLASCKQCRQELADLQQTVLLVGELDEVEPPADLLQRVNAQIEADAVAGNTTSSWNRRLWVLLSNPQVRVAAALLVVLLSIHALRYIETDPTPIYPQTDTAPEHSPSRPSPPVADDSADTDLLMEMPDSRPTVEQTPPIDKKTEQGAASRRRRTGAEVDGAIWGLAKDAEIEAESSRPAPSEKFGIAPNSKAGPAERESARQDIVADKRALAAPDEIVEEKQDKHIEAITVLAADRSIVARRIAPFIQNEDSAETCAIARRSKAGVPHAAGAEAPKQGAPIIHVHVTADRYEELVAALDALGRAPSDADSDKAVKVVVTIVQP